MKRANLIAKERGLAKVRVEDIVDLAASRWGKRSRLP